MLCRWLASLPVQLSQLGHRNPALSAQIITSIQAAASRGHKDLLDSLQTNACTIYGMSNGYLIAHIRRWFNHFDSHSVPCLRVPREVAMCFFRTEA